MMTFLRTFFIALLVFFPATAETISLEQALDLARTNAWDMQIIKAKFKQAHALVFKTVASYLPHITLTGNYTHNAEESKIKLALGPTEIKKIVIQPLNQLGVQAQLNQMLISPWLISQLSNLGKYDETTRLSNEHAKRELLFGVAQTYYAVAAHKDAIALQNRLLEGRKAHEKDAKLRFDNGYIIKAEVLRAEIEVSKNEQDLALAQNAFTNAKLALATMLNRDADFDVISPPPPRSLNPEEQNIKSIEENRLDIKAARFQAELLQSMQNRAVLRYLPDLSFFLQYKGSNTAGLGGNKNNFALGLNLTWNIFDGGLREAEIYENSGKALEAHAVAESKALHLRQDVETAKVDLKSAQANQEKIEKQLLLAKENFRLISSSKELGAASYLEFVDASDNLANAELSLIAQGLQVNLAALKLQHTLGLFQ
jgi:outer membrane protein TolC